MAGQSSDEKLLRLRKEFKPPSKTNPFSRIAESIGSVNFINPPNDPMRHRRGSKVRIALVSMPVFDYDVAPFTSLCTPVTPPEGVDPTVFDRTLVSFQSATARRMLAIFSEALDVAVSEFHADVICFNELGFPTEGMVPMAEAKHLARTTSQKHGVLIVAGSGHDARTLFNTGYIFRPNGPESGESFHKTISAKSVGELINAPASRRIAAVEFCGLKIAVMICLDVADYASIASVVKVGDGVHVLLVPCYTTKFEAMGAIADVTSKALPGIVAMVNAEIPDADARCYRISSFGDREKPLESKTIGAGAVISVVDIDHVAFQTKRTAIQMPGDHRRDIEYLFGRRDMPIVHSPAI